MQQIPVYLFTGFLDAGKTRFIRETLEDPRYNDGTPTLLLLCEEGEEEYDTAKMPHPVAIQVIEEPEELRAKVLARMAKSCRAQRVFVEYNGMWDSRTLFEALPEGWIVVQEFCFIDSTTIMAYNANMRNLVADKLQTAEMVIFNRMSPDTDVMPYHKLVRGLSRRAEIVYEDIDGKVTPDTIEDPLPFDLNAPVVQIEDRDFAIWYRDLTEELEQYDGKTVCLKGRVVIDDRSDGSFFVFGREMMTCCVDDIQFAGVVCRYPDSFSLRNGQWAVVTAGIQLGDHPAYGRRGPILNVLEVEDAPAPEEPVASFY